MKKAIFFIAFLAVISFALLTQEIYSQKIEKIYVPDKTTSIKIAEAIWLPIYGEEIYNYKPFISRLKNGKIWIVEGTLAKGNNGGAPYVEIQKKDGKILKVTHGK
jgi:hypothetical protein